MPDHRADGALCRLATMLGLLWIIIGLVAPVWAGVVNFTELLPYVDMNIPGWTMEGRPCGTTLQQGKVMVSEARVSFKAGNQTLEIIIMDFLGKTIPFLTGQQVLMDTGEETAHSTEVQGFKAFATFRLQEKQGELNISVADRFWVKIDAEGIDNPEILTKVAQKMDLKKLATLAR
jgi:hypothetical protein